MCRDRSGAASPPMAVPALPRQAPDVQGVVSMNGKHIELFLVDGISGGITTVEMAGWTGHVLAAPRAQLSAMMGRPEVKRNGVYFLLGDDQTAIEGARCYVGKTENFVNRVRDHE